MRIVKGITRGTPISFSFDGQSYIGYAGESLACALYACGVKHLRSSPGKAEARGIFCLMGSCQECLVWVDKQKKPSCQVALYDGLNVFSIHEEAQE